MTPLRSPIVRPVDSLAPLNNMAAEPASDPSVGLARPASDPHSQHILAAEGDAASTVLHAASASGDEDQRKRQHVAKIVSECTSLGSVPAGAREALMERLSKETVALFRIPVPEIRQRKADGSLRWPNNLFGWFVELYFKAFHDLWPLFHKASFKVSSVPPPLYLTIAIIGATYGTREAAEFGCMVHELLRSELIASLLDLRTSNAPSEADCQTLLLNQVFALYVGQRRSFFIAQQLEAVLLVQARRIGLFREPGRLDMQNIQVETRRRLAYGILRAHTYTFLLLGTPAAPLWEELEVGLLLDEEWWLEDSQYASARIARHQERRSVQFNDLVRLFLNGDEQLAPMRPVDQELVLMALASHVWSIGRNRFIFRRLCKDEGQFSCITQIDAHRRETSKKTVQDATSETSRKDTTEALWGTYDLVWPANPELGAYKAQLRVFLDALERWKLACLASKGFSLQKADRSRIFSCHILYHLTLLHLFADMDDLHNLAWHCTPAAGWDDRASSLLQNAIRWKGSTDSEAAVRQAQSIYTMISHEVLLTAEHRAAHNILAFSELGPAVQG